VIKVQRREQPPLWVVISPLSRRLRKVIGQEDEVALVYGHTPSIFGVKQQSMLETFYGMTPAEQRVALLNMQGYKLDEAADRLSISRNTLRTHLKRIYVKTNTNRQSDLVRVLFDWALESKTG
jgi:DNA-binding CsgD family transcriptional regulator